jgi:CDP-4-dehydro-6-deoxyglucose reductase, E1
VVVGVRRYPLAQVSYGSEEIAAVNDALNAGQTTCGVRVKAFEQAFGRYVGTEYAIMVNSGSSADLLVAYGLGPAEFGDEVLVPAVTWPTQVWSCLQAGYTVRLVDVDPETLQFSEWSVFDSFNDRVRAFFPVHVLGNVGRLERIAEDALMMDLKIIEDCCEALGARWLQRHVGTFGQAAAFSFFFSHLVNTMEGGMVVCHNLEDDRQYRLWRSHGWEPKVDYRFWFPTWGMNVRPTELQGAFGVVQMGRLEGFRLARQANALRLREWTEHACLRQIRVLPECEPSWHGFPLMVAPDAPFSRDTLCRHLEEHGIETRPIIAGNLARQPAVMAEDRIIKGPLPGADAVHDRGFYIGLASYDDPDGCGYVAEVVRDFLKAH